MIIKLSFIIILLVLTFGETLKKTSSQHLQVYDYIIVGAGISGLKSAEILLDHNKKILMLEGMDKIGGKIESLKLRDIPSLNQKQWFKEKLSSLPDLALDLGASEIQDFETDILQICKQQKFELRDIIKQGKDILFYKGQRYFPDELIKQNQQLKSEFQRVFKQFKKDQQIYSNILDNNLLIFPQHKKQFINYDTTSTLDYFESLNIKNHMFKEMLLNKIQSTLTIEPQLVNIGFVLSGLQAIYHELLQTFGLKTRQLKKEVVGGSLRIIDSIVRRIQEKGNQIEDFCKFNYQVTKINNSEDIIKIYAKKSNQQNGDTMVFLSRKVINAIAIIPNQRVEISKISKAKRFYLNKSLISSFTKVFIITPKPFDIPGLTGTITMGQQNEYASLMRDYSPDSKQIGSYLFYIGKPQMKKWQKLAQREKNQYLWNIIIQGYALNSSSPEVRFLKEESVFLEYSLCNNFFIGASGIGEPTGIYSGILNMGADISNFKNNQFGIAYVCSEMSEDTAFYMEGGLKNAKRRVMEMLNQETDINAK